MISKLLFLVVFAVCSLIPSVRPDACEDLNYCIDQIEVGPNGTWTFLSLESKPATEVDWTTLWKKVCRLNYVRYSCIYNHMCKDPDAKDRAREARTAANTMCGTEAVKFYKRVYRVPGSCLGNKTAYELQSDNLLSCIAGLSDALAQATTIQQRCQTLTDAMKCDSDYGFKLCGYLGRWLTEQIWKIKVRVYFRECFDYKNFYHLPERI